MLKINYRFSLICTFFLLCSCTPQNCTDIGNNTPEHEFHIYNDLTDHIRLNVFTRGVQEEVEIAASGEYSYWIRCLLPSAVVCEPGKVIISNCDSLDIIRNDQLVLKHRIKGASLFKEESKNRYVFRVEESFVGSSQ